MGEASAQLPQGAYTTFRTYGRDRVLRLALHVRRLQESAALMGAAGVVRDMLGERVARDALAQAIQRTGYAESRIRLTLAPPRFFVSIEPFTPYPEALYEQGVCCVTVTLRRDTPHAKSTAFIASAGEAYRTLPTGVHEGLMVAEDGAVLEGLSSNFFALLDGVLHTEQERALVGVTQSLALEVAGKAMPALPISTHAIQLGDVARVGECFITSVSREILPVVRIDDHTIGTGTPGRVTRQLINGLHALIAREAEPVD
jgi:branched-chain amino acid aminotransferase